MNFDHLTRDVVDKIGFIFGLPSPCVFSHREKNMRAYVYGDTFVVKGLRRELYDFL